MAPQVRFTTAPVIAPAPSEAGNAAVSATSLSRGRGGGQEVRARGLDDRAREVVHGQVDERDTLHGGEADGIQRNVDAPRSLGDVGGVSLHGLLVGGIYLGCLDDSSRSGDLLGHHVKRRQRSTREEHFPAFAGEGAPIDPAPPKTMAFLCSSKHVALR